MMKTSFSPLNCLLLAGGMLLGVVAESNQVVQANELAKANASNADAATQFVRRIAPLLREKCIGCHGTDPDTIEGSLDFTNASSLTEPGDSGALAIVPGDADASPFYLAITRQHNDWSAMPPKDSEALSAEQLAWVREWIAGGAAWPDLQRQTEIAAQFADAWSVEDGVIVATSGGLSGDWTNRRYDPHGLWGYQPVVKPTLPKDIDSAQVHPIDYWIDRQLPESLAVAPRADRATLLRRATFDLTGLPPTPHQMEVFLVDSRDDRAAFAALVDRLLGSPHYGERMAQHWLDVVRYADSSGFANDYERGNAWRYRDYVIRAFNDDKPYDQFIREQIAGDEIDPEDPEKILATGFLRMGPWELTGMEVAKVARQRFLDDVTNSVGETFLAHSLQCARCHDHKFDPVPTRDYYSIQGVFATTQLVDRTATFLPEENLGGFDEETYLDQRAEDYEQKKRELDDILLENAQRWFAENQLPSAAWDAAVRQIQGGDETNAQYKRGGVFTAARSSLMKQGVPEDEFPPKSVGFTPAQFGLERVVFKGLERLNWERDRYRPYALAVYSGRTPTMDRVKEPLRMPANRMQQGELEQTCILTGGDPFSAGEGVAPGVLSVLQSPPMPTIPDAIAGRRLAFADWVADERNPLTTRTLVNRLWLWHFNQPIAGNPNNFGSTGKRPTHPELLDHLAAMLVESDWSIKAMQRWIMSSDAYCRSSQHASADTLRELDPLGTSYAAFLPRRLTAEEIRDAMLIVTGELNPQQGGIPCRPVINQEIALQPRQVMGTFAAAWTPNPLPQQRNRRSIYVLKLRGLMDPMLEIFNVPSPDFSCEQREASTVTPQVFALFNSHSSHTRALALAQRAWRETGDRQLAIQRCFEWVLARNPSAQELQECLDHWAEIEALLPQQPAATPQPPKSVLREAVEENTGEKFRFQERLYTNDHFVPDVQPSDVAKHVRALADLCLVLINANEFVYVY